MNIPESIQKTGLKIPWIRSFIRAYLFEKRWSRPYPPGHFYSPLPSSEEVDRWSQGRGRGIGASGLKFNFEAQQELISTLAGHYAEIPFKSKPVGDLRYYYDNNTFCEADGIFLHLLVRHLKPRQIVEVGSGFSSAVMLDTADRFLPGDIRLTFIEPYTDRLRKLLRSEDYNRCTIIEKPVQDVELGVFTALQAGDILFIDSTHVAKVGSDVNFLIFEVLPRLQPGVWIHIHDIFSDFDYPVEWVRNGLAWNESYLVRAFLLFNNDFEIMLHVPDSIGRHRDWFKKNMPDCLANAGGSLWIRRK